jgi:hypothetical protein
VASLFGRARLILRRACLSIGGWWLRHRCSRSREGSKLSSVERLGLLLLLGSGRRDLGEIVIESQRALVIRALLLVGVDFLDGREL